MKRFLAVLTGGIMAFGLLSPVAIVTAQSNNCDPIRSGLTAGANLRFDLNNCDNTQNNSSVARPQIESELNETRDQLNQSFRPAPSSQRSNLYIGLGDSVAAGLGLSAAAKLQNNDAVCGISPQSYVSYVAASVQKSYINAACSGATAGDIVTEQHLSGTSRDIEPQLDTAFAYGVPELITITAGANDMRWVDFLRKCYASECGTSFDETASRALRRALELKLEYVMNEINRRSNGNPPRVVLTGYYDVLSANCNLDSGSITAAEVNWFRGKINELNSTVQKVTASYIFARFAPVNFNGHELCSAEPWVQGANELAPFHPTARCQQATAQSVISNIR